MDSRLLVLYRVLAIVTGTGLVILTFVGLPLKYGFGRPTVVTVVGIAHGWLFMAYVLVTLVLWYSRRWPLVKLGLVLLAGTVPVATFFAERRVVADERRMVGTATPPQAQRLT